MDFRDFISKCCTKDPNERLSAKELLQHNWIRQAKGIRIIQQLVQKSQPKVEEMRKKKKEEEEAKQREEELLEQAEMREYGNEEDYGGDQYGTTVYNDGTAIYNDGTMIRADDNGIEPGYDDATSGTTVYNDNTMIRGDDYGGDNYGTMLIQNEDDDAKNEDHENNAIYGTMYINDGFDTGKINMDGQNGKKIKILESMFKDNKYVDQLLPIPSDVTKEELFSIFTRIKTIDKGDKENLEKFYKEQIRLLDEKIKQLGE